MDERGKLVPVLPVTAQRWMNSQSSYHSLARLPDGRWLAFLRGTGGEYLLCWSESNPYDGGPKIIYGRTRDFRSVERDERGYANWPMADGLISPWREGRQLYLFAGKHLHVMDLPVSSAALPEPTTPSEGRSFGG
jgi:hypothetical protein